MKEFFEANTQAIVQQAVTAESIHDELEQDANNRSWWRAERLWRLKEEFGETDAEIATRHGWTRGYVNLLRLVWSGFGKGYERYPGVTFKHCKAVLAWPDADECLEWASENKASVKEMKAWRRMQRGEDLTGPEEEEQSFYEDEDGEQTDALADALLASAKKHVADVDPHQKPPSRTKNTPRDHPETAPDYDPNEPALKPTETKRKSVKPKAAETVEETRFSLDDLQKLLKAAEDTAGDVRETRKLAAWHRRRADELDPQTSKSRPGTVECVSAHVAENDLRVDPESWFDFYESNGWRVGKNPMRDWKAAIRRAHKEGWAAPEGQKKTPSLMGSLQRFVDKGGDDEAA